MSATDRDGRDGRDDRDDRDVDDVIGRVTRWATTRPEVVGLLLVGSQARGTARPDSDVDLVALTTDPALTAREAAGLALGEPVRVQRWGPVTERRYLTASGRPVELNLAAPDWARTDPVDPGTRRIVTDGARPLHDPAGRLAALLAACDQPTGRAE